jgi:hypothetical protein
MPARKKTKKKTSFVPRVVYATAIVGATVIPLCVSACGGKIQGNPGPGGGFTVAAISFDSGPGFSVADTGFDSGTDTGIGFIVAAAGFDSGFGVADTGFQGTVAAMGFEAGDAPFGVADVSFTVAAMGFDSGPPADAGEG